MKPKLN